MSDRKKKRGRPSVEIDVDKLEVLCQAGCANWEIAAYLGVSERTIESRRRNAKFRAVMDRGVALGDISLRKAQMTLALKGNPAMLIWLGKQRLGQMDKIENKLTGPNGGPIEVTRIERVIVDPQNPDS